MSENKIYIIENGEQAGPFTVAELQLRGVTGDTPVWMPGMVDWKPLKDVPELKLLMDDDSAFGTYAQPDESQYSQPEPQAQYEHSYPDPKYYAMIAGIQLGPMPVSVLMMRGLTPDTPVWREGMDDWQPASTRSDIMNIIQAYQQGEMQVPGKLPGVAGKYQKPYHQMQQQMSPQQVNPQPVSGAGRTNWMTPAIIALILGICSVIPLVLSIVGIVNANKANKAFAMGDYSNGDRYNSTAKICVIIAFVLEGLSFIIGFMQWPSVLWQLNNL